MGCNKCNTKCDSNCNCVVRYTGPNIDCLGISTGDSFETVMSTISQFVCNINFEDGVGIENMTYDSDADTLSVYLTDGTDYFFTGLQGEDGQSIDHTSFTSSTGGGAASQPGETDTYTVWGDAGETINMGTFTVYNGADGIDANSNYGNTLFVDQIYGDNSTAQRERFDLPYEDIATALSDSQTGDTVWVRSGEYTENITLLDNVDMYFEDVILTGKIDDGGNPVASNVTGRLSIVHDSNDTIGVTGAGSNISIKMLGLSSEGNAIIVNSTTEQKTILNLDVEYIEGLSFNYCATVRGNSHLDLKVKKSIETLSNMSNVTGFSMFSLNSTFRGFLKVSCPKIYIGNSENSGSGVFYSEEPETATSARVFIDVDEIEIDYSYASANGSATINKQGSSKAFFNIKSLSTPFRDGIHIAGDKDGYMYYSGRLFADRSYPFRYSSSQKVVIKDSSLKKGSGGSDTNETIVIGAPGAIPALSSGVETGYKLEIVDTEIIKDAAVNNATEGIIFKSGDPSINLKNVEIVGIGTFAGFSAKTDGGTEDEIYFKNVTGNTDIDATTVTDISAGASGFTDDPNLVVYDYIN